MKIFFTPIKYAVITCLMILISSSVYGQFETQKFQVMVANAQNHFVYDHGVVKLYLNQYKIDGFEN
jgi:hypothetical protein